MGIAKLLVEMMSVVLFLFEHQVRISPHLFLSIPCSQFLFPFLFLHCGSTPSTEYGEALWLFLNICPAFFQERYHMCLDEPRARKFNTSPPASSADPYLVPRHGRRRAARLFYRVELQ